MANVLPQRQTSPNHLVWEKKPYNQEGPVLTAGDTLASPSSLFPLLSTDPFPSTAPARGAEDAASPGWHGVGDQPGVGDQRCPRRTSHKWEMPSGCRREATGSSASPARSLPPHTLPVKLFESLPAVFAARNNRLAMI